MATCIRLDPGIEWRLGHLPGQTGRSGAYFQRKSVRYRLIDAYCLAAMEGVRQANAVYSAAQVRADLALTIGYTATALRPVR